MTNDEEKELKDGLTSERNIYEKIMSEARGKRAELRLQNRDKHTDFLQKVGELSFTFGAAIIPLIFITHSASNIKSLVYILIGVGIYLLNGVIALWKNKSVIEQDADDSPHVGLDEEINTYPIINSINKLLTDISSDDHKDEYVKSKKDFLEFAFSIKSDFKAKATFWLDLVILNFVLASLVVGRALWPYNQIVYWIGFAAIILIMVGLITLSYIRTIRNQMNLHIKKERLAKIKADYQDWYNKTMLNR
jgi:hypothetical protein